MPRGQVNRLRVRGKFGSDLCVDLMVEIQSMTSYICKMYLGDLVVLELLRSDESLRA